MNFTPDAKEVRYTMVGILLGLFLAALDQTIVSTAMPRWGHELTNTPTLPPASRVMITGRPPTRRVRKSWVANGSGTVAPPCCEEKTTRSSQAASALRPTALLR